MNARDAMSISQSRGQIVDLVRCLKCSDDRQVELIKTYGIARYFCATCSHDWDARHVISVDDSSQKGQQ